MENRFNDFTENELYMLKRQAIESSANIVMTSKYTSEEIEIHNRLLSEIIEAIKNSK